MRKLSTILVIALSLSLLFAIPALAGGPSGSNANANANANAGATATSGSFGLNTGDVNNSNTFNNPGNIESHGKGYRGFANQAELNYPGMPAYFGTPTPGSSFQSIERLTMYKVNFTADELEKMAATNTFGSKVVVTPLVKEVDKDQRVSNIQLFLKKPEAKVKLVGYIMVKATGDDTVSPEVMAECMLAARKLGANAVHVSAEGVERVMKAFGWGIGLAYTKASLSADETDGGVASGGTGISGGQASYKDRPWLQVFAIVVE